MPSNGDDMQSSTTQRFILHPHRSLTARGFMLLMVFIGLVSFAVGMAFLLMGAWPVFGFFGLDVALIYLAFRLNFRSGRLYETVDVSPEQLVLTRVHPAGRREVFDFNTYWVRLKLSQDRPDGRTSLRLSSQGREVLFGQFLTDDERGELADALGGALLQARGAQI